MSDGRVRSGRQARQAERAQKGAGHGRPYIVRNIPTYDVLSEENLQKIEAAADRVLAETGIEFRDDPVALDHWKRAGAKVDGLLVRFEPGMLREILKSAPAEFTQHARDCLSSNPGKRGFAQYALTRDLGLRFGYSNFTLGYLGTRRALIFIGKLLHDADAAHGHEITRHAEAITAGDRQIVDPNH